MTPIDQLIQIPKIENITTVPDFSTDVVSRNVATSCRTLWILILAHFAFLLAQETTAQSLTYPATRRDSVVDVYFDIKVSDPYRWLEQLDSPATAEWVKAQSQVTFDHLKHLPDRNKMQERLTALWNYRRTSVPWREAGRLFFEENTGLQPQAVLYEQKNPDEPPRVVLDPQEISPDGSTAISDFAISPDGRWLAYSASPGGADVGKTHVRDLASGREHGDVLHRTWGTVCWTFDGGGFFYMRTPAPRPGQGSEAARLTKQVLYHVLGQPQEQDRLIREWPDARWLYCMMSDDGRRALIVMERGASSWMHVLDLRDPKASDLNAPLVTLLAGVEAAHVPMGTVGDILYVATNFEAPRGRVIALDLTQGANAQPRTVIPEGPAVIQGATVAGNRLAVHYIEDVKSRLLLFTLDGQPAGEVALPGIGAIGWALNGRNSVPELLYSFTSFLMPRTVYHYDLRTGVNTAFRPPDVPFDPSPYETRQVFYNSKDGTRVPMFITTRKDLRLDGTSPAMLTGYGGYGAVENPRFTPDVVLWLEMGGIYAVANMRGGGEYGEEWHRVGNLERKQNSFDDFIAAAEYLVARRYAAPGRIAIHGHSNGGLLIGAMITQRPDLFGAAVANAGHHDMLRYHKFTVGAGWIPEYGSSDNAANFKYLYAYSPLHNVRPGTCYPATLLLAADHDDRVVPSHSYKFAAALQAAQACDRPILLRVAIDASHSYASGAEAIAERTDMWAFIAKQLGVKMNGTKK